MAKVLLEIFVIRSGSQLLNWIKVYNSGGILKTSTGGAYMRKAKKTTLDERLKIVNFKTKSYSLKSPNS